MHPGSLPIRTCTATSSPGASRSGRDHRVRLLRKHRIDFNSGGSARREIGGGWSHWQRGLCWFAATRGLPHQPDQNHGPGRCDRVQMRCENPRSAYPTVPWVGAAQSWTVRDLKMQLVTVMELCSDSYGIGKQKPSSDSVRKGSTSVPQTVTS